ncbi:hypothetical protein FD29_GL001373 [Companilactobacillus mindensis DSM 14500]|uniref:Uncharacterized protein n=1 Tax=Companilactobacillus mindensis DSM 14500 TaxID=1423770 RepID=A0A0R1QNE6_9LACO|nr:hypothetical protein FD29_GL001373 [Companilactobacillus mindensis DSM 14500]GEO78003.1 hypothetical protein LMI01_03340 [Companilactobacillus mindensis]
MPTKNAMQVYNQDQKLPKLFRTFNKRQYIELFIGLVTLFLRGIGGIFLIISLLDFYFFSAVLTVRNMNTGETFLMDKTEWQKYRKNYKQAKKSL